MTNPTPNPTRELQGSPKQIAWALDIRKRLEAEALSLVASVPEHRKAAVQSACNAILDIPWATFYIENRYKPMMDIVRRATSSYGLQSRGSEYGEILRLDFNGQPIA